MTKHLPPIPPESRSPKGPGDKSAMDPDAGNKLHGAGGDTNYDQQSQEGNVKQNTTNQGYQQDR